MREGLTKITVLEQTTRLVNALGLPYGVDPEGQAEEFLRAFTKARVTLPQVRAAVDVAVTKPGKFPTPHDLVLIIRQGRETPPPEPNQGACPVCRAVYFAAGYEPAGGLPRLRMRCLCPTSAPGWWTPAALSCRETEPHMPQPPADYDANPAYRNPKTKDPTLSVGKSL